MFGIRFRAPKVPRTPPVPCPTRTRRFQPGVEVLEDRTVPANLPVVIVPGLTGSLPVGVNSSNSGDVLNSLIDFAFNLGPAPTSLTAQFDIDINFFGNQIDFTSPYNSLVAAFQANGYVLGRDLFVAPYDWRLGIAPQDGVADGVLSNATPQMLSDNLFEYGVDYMAFWMRTAAQQWQAANPGQPLVGVNVVAHSMGNLVTRAYIQSAAYNTSPLFPRVNNFIMLAGPNQGASEIFNFLNNNFIGAGADTTFENDVVKYVLDPVFGSLGNPTPVNGPNGQPLITQQSVTNPATGQPDPQLFIQQYLPGLRDLMATYNFLDGGNVNSSTAFRNNLLLDMNGGPDPNSFAADKKVVALFGNTIPTPDTVTTRFGVGGQVFPVANPSISSPVNTVVGQTWFQDNVVPNAGDGTVGIQSLVSTFAGDPRITLIPLAGITHDTVVTDPAVQALIVSMLRRVFVPPTYIVVGAAAGTAPMVHVYDQATGRLKFAIRAYPGRFRGGVRVAAGDVNGDGFPDILVVNGPGRRAQVRIFNGFNGALLREFFVNFGGRLANLVGAFIASGDVNNDGFADVIVGAGLGRARVLVFSGRDGALLRDFHAFGPNFQGGVRVAAGDINHDGFADVIAGAGPDDPARVLAFSGSNGGLLRDFLARRGGNPGGLFVSAGDFTGDLLDDIVVGFGSAPPRVTIFNSATRGVLGSFLAGHARFEGGVHVATIRNSLGVANDVLGLGKGAPPRIRVLNGQSLALVRNFLAFKRDFSEGVFVAAR